MTYQKLSPKQLQAMLWWAQKDTKHYDALICDGSVRSGKTMAMSVGFVLWSCRRFDGQRFAFCGKTIDSLKRNVIDPLQQWLEGIAQIKINYSKNFMDISISGNVNRYYMFGGKDESSSCLIQGITLAGVLLDEVALMPRSFVEQAIVRCSVPDSKFWFNCNPESSEHWFYKEWILKAEDKNALHLHMTMQDNYSLAEDVIKRYESNFQGVFYDRYIKGLWVLAEGLVYPMFDKNKHVIKEYSPPDNAEYYISIDYGTLNPTSMGLWAVDEEKAVRIDEYYYSGRDKQPRTDEEHYKALEKLAGDRHIKYVVVDPSAASFITTIRRHGRFVVRQARNDVLNGIRYTSTLIANGKILISPECKGILKEFALYRWDEDKPEDKVIKENDHAMDDLRYFCYTILRNKYKGVTD